MKKGFVYASDGTCMYSASMFVLNFTEIGQPAAARWNAGLTEEDSAHVSIFGGLFGAAYNSALWVTFFKHPSLFAPIFLNITGVAFIFSSVLVFSGMPSPGSQIRVTGNTFAIDAPNTRAGNFGVLCGIVFSNVITTDLSVVDFVLSGPTTRVRVSDNSVNGALHYSNPVLNQKNISAFFILVIASNARLSDGATFEIEGNSVARGPSAIDKAPKDINVVALLMHGALQIDSGATLSLSGNRLGSSFTLPPADGGTDPLSAPNHVLPEPQIVVNSGSATVLLRGELTGLGVASDNSLLVTGTGSRLTLDGNTITRLAPGYFPAGSEFVVAAARILMCRIVVNDSAVVSLSGNVAAAIGSNTLKVTAIASLLGVTGDGPTAYPFQLPALHVTGGAMLRIQRCVSALHNGQAVTAAAVAIVCEADQLLLDAAGATHDASTMLRVSGGGHGVGPSTILIANNVVWGVRKEALRIYVAAIIAPRLLIESAEGGGGSAVVNFRENSGIDNEVKPNVESAALPQWGFSRELQTTVLLAAAAAVTVSGPNTALHIGQNTIKSSASILATVVDIRIGTLASTDSTPIKDDWQNAAPLPLSVGPNGGEVLITENSVTGIRNVAFTPPKSVAYHRLRAVALTVNGSIVINASSSSSPTGDASSAPPAAVATLEISVNVVDGGLGGVDKSAFAVVVSTAGALHVGSINQRIAAATAVSIFNISYNSLGRFTAGAVTPFGVSSAVSVTVGRTLHVAGLGAVMDLCRNRITDIVAASASETTGRCASATALSLTVKYTPSGVGGAPNTAPTYANVTVSGGARIVVAENAIENTALCTTAAAAAIDVGSLCVSSLRDVAGGGRWCGVGSDGSPYENENEDSSFPSLVVFHRNMLRNVTKGFFAHALSAKIGTTVVAGRRSALLASANGALWMGAIPRIYVARIDSTATIPIVGSLEVSYGGTVAVEGNYCGRRGRAAATGDSSSNSPLHEQCSYSHSHAAGSAIAITRAVRWLLANSNTTTTTMTTVTETPVAGIARSLLHALNIGGANALASNHPCMSTDVTENVASGSVVNADVAAAVCMQQHLFASSEDADGGKANADCAAATSEIVEVANVNMRDRLIATNGALIAVDGNTLANLRDFSLAVAARLEASAMTIASNASLAPTVNTLTPAALLSSSTYAVDSAKAATALPPTVVSVSGNVANNILRDPSLPAPAAGYAEAIGAIVHVTGALRVRGRRIDSTNCSSLAGYPTFASGNNTAAVDVIWGRRQRAMVGGMSGSGAALLTVSCNTVASASAAIVTATKVNTQNIAIIGDARLCASAPPLPSHECLAANASFSSGERCETSVGRFPAAAVELSANAVVNATCWDARAAVISALGGGGEILVSAAAVAVAPAKELVVSIEEAFGGASNGSQAAPLDGDSACTCAIELPTFSNNRPYFFKPGEVCDICGNGSYACAANTGSPPKRRAFVAGADYLAVPVAVIDVSANRLEKVEGSTKPAGEAILDYLAPHFVTAEVKAGVSGVSVSAAATCHTGFNATNSGIGGTNTNATTANALSMISLPHAIAALRMSDNAARGLRNTTSPTAALLISINPYQPSQNAAWGEGRGPIKAVGQRALIALSRNVVEDIAGSPKARGVALSGDEFSAYDGGAFVVAGNRIRNVTAASYGPRAVYVSATRTLSVSRTIACGSAAMAMPGGAKCCNWLLDEAALSSPIAIGESKSPHSNECDAFELHGYRPFQWGIFFDDNGVVNVSESDDGPEIGLNLSSGSLGASAVYLELFDFAGVTRPTVAPNMPPPKLTIVSSAGAAAVFSVSRNFVDRGSFAAPSSPSANPPHATAVTIANAGEFSVGRESVFAVIGNWMRNIVAAAGPSTTSSTTLVAVGISVVHIYASASPAAAVAGGVGSSIVISGNVLRWAAVGGGIGSLAAVRAPLQGLDITNGAIAAMSHNTVSNAPPNKKEFCKCLSSCPLQLDCGPRTDPIACSSPSPAVAALLYESRKGMDDSEGSPPRSPSHMRVRCERHMVCTFPPLSSL